MLVTNETTIQRMIEAMRETGVDITNGDELVSTGTLLIAVMLRQMLDAGDITREQVDGIAKWVARNIPIIVDQYAIPSKTRPQ